MNGDRYNRSALVILFVGSSRNGGFGGGTSDSAYVRCGQRDILLFACLGLGCLPRGMRALLEAGSSRRVHMVQFRRSLGWGVLVVLKMGLWSFEEGVGHGRVGSLRCEMFYYHIPTRLFSAPFLVVWLVWGIVCIVHTHMSNQVKTVVHIQPVGVCRWVVLNMGGRTAAQVMAPATLLYHPLSVIISPTGITIALL